MRTLTRRIVTEPPAPFPPPAPASVRPRRLRSALPALAFLVAGALVLLVLAQREIDRQSQALVQAADAFFDRVAAELTRAVDNPVLTCGWLRSGTPLPAGFELLREPVAAGPAGRAWCPPEGLDSSVTTSAPAAATVPDATPGFRPGRAAGLALGNWAGDPSALLAEIVFPDGRTLGARIDAGALASLLQPAGVTAAGELQWQDGGHWRLPDPDARINGSAPLISAQQRSSRHPYSAHASLDGTALWRMAGEWLAALAGGALLIALGVRMARERRRTQESTPAEQLRQALARGEFEGHLQPILDLASGRCVGAELLLHWRHPGEGLLAAGHFIDQARQAELSWLMTENCFIEVAARLDQCEWVPDGFMLCVNLSSAELARERDSERFMALARPGGRRWYTVIELPEGQAREPAMAGRLATLQDAGFLIALDRFGTAHSGTRWLDRMSVDLVKIDPAIVATIGTDSVTRPVLDAIIELGRQTGVRLIAEGVINTQQAAHLRREGVSYGQGRAFSGPLPAAQFIASWLGAEHAPNDDDIADDDDDDDDPSAPRPARRKAAPALAPAAPLTPGN
jgi:EAL domain-containing protein (putative c-di-GMP-specific phosphodiesterase class I)